MFDTLFDIFTSKHLLFGVMVFSASFKVIALLAFLRYGFRTSLQRLAAFFLIVYFIGTLLSDIDVLVWLLKSILGFSGLYPGYTFFCRIVWSVYITTFQALALFLICLVKKRFQFGLLYGINAFVNIVISGGYLYLAFFKYSVPASSPETLPYELGLYHAMHVYRVLLFIPVFYKILRRSTTQEVPVILSHQLRYLSYFFMFALLYDIISQTLVSFSAHFPAITPYRYTFFTLTEILSTVAMYLIIKRVVGLRFLNFRETVESKEKFNFLSQFRDILEQLSYATVLKELAHLTQTFFNKAFAIPLGRTRLYIRKANQEDDDGSFDLANMSTHVEQFIGKQENETITKALQSSKIFIRDEIHFTNYYEDDETSREILNFLDVLNADIFLPVYERNAISAYIIVERGARPEKLFTNKDRDEMLVFTTYLSNIINILKYSNIEAMHQRHKQLTEELYLKHQENNQYKESIRSFLRTNKDRKIGIVFYKYRKFTIANEAAQQLVGFDLNSQEGHPLTQAFRSIARRVVEYKTTQSLLTRDNSGNKIIVAGIPSLEENAPILLIYYPEISDILRSQLEQLKDPSSWDYTLYLETTQSGRVINELIPGSGEKLLAFKINLLSTALSKKATLLELPEADLETTVEILHSISLRQVLHTMKLTVPEKNDEAAIKLFGLNPLMQKDAAPALLEKLDNVGTLFIQNIEYLGVATQEYLAEFISFGFFNKYKSDHKVFSNVRIVCSTSKDLLELVNQGRFSKALYNELQQTSVVMPPLHELSPGEIEALMRGFADQMTASSQTYKNLLTLSDKDSAKILQDRPLSLKELRDKVHQIIITKSTRNNIAEVSEFDPAYNVSDPDIAHAVRLGKKALKDPQIMSILWNKFRNQNKIATLLGVNRSSVNRRCQEYGLTN